LGHDYRGQTPFEDLSYRRKEDVRAFQNSIAWD